MTRPSTTRLAPTLAALAGLLLLPTTASAAPQGPPTPDFGGYHRPRSGGDWYFMVINDTPSPIDYGADVWLVEHGGAQTNVSGWGVVPAGGVSVVTNMTIVDFTARWGPGVTVGGSSIALLPAGTTTLRRNGAIIDTLDYVAPLAGNPAPARQCPAGFLGDLTDANWVDAYFCDVFGSYFALPIATNFVGNPRGWLAPVRPIGRPYCAANPNSTGEIGRCDATGSEVVVDNNLTLAVRKLPAGTLGFFIVSMMQGFVPNPGGSQGNLCLGGAIGRYAGNIFMTDATGAASLQVDLTAIPQPAGTVAIMSGESWSFQAWYRDGNPTPTSNFTEGLEILFQ